MKRFDIVVGKSVGDIVFGMSRDDARELLGEYRDFDNSFIKELNSSLEVKSFDQFSYCNLGYDKDDKVEFVTFHTFDDIEITHNNKVISAMTALELFSFIHKLDSNTVIEVGGVSFTSNTLGIAASFEKAEVILLSTETETTLEKLESISIAVPEYWNKDEIK